MPNDCFTELLWHNSIQISYKIAGKSMFRKFREYKIKSANRNRIVYTKMFKILPGSDWIEVDSAFGGLAIYKSKSFLHYDYTKIIGQVEQRCEHIELHEKIQHSGGKIFINPSLINQTYNEYNLNRICFIRKARDLKRFIKKLH
jgi:hypothetical protein